MPLYMDIHKIEGVTSADLAKAHAADLAAQRGTGVEYLKYWFNEDCGKVFCLVHAPSADAAAAVHRDAHGFLAEKIIEVQPELVEGMMGNAEADGFGAALLPGVSMQQRDPGMRSILFTDIVGSTAHTQAVGDAEAMTLVHAHDRIVRTALAVTGGREVKHTGDGMMCAFISAQAAMRCAAQIQRELAVHNQSPANPALHLRMGVSAGEPVEEHHDLYGASVQLAARLCAHAQPGQIVVSNVVVELCLGKPLPFRDLGEVALKGFPKPVRVHEFDWAESATA